MNKHSFWLGKSLHTSQYVAVNNTDIEYHLLIRTVCAAPTFFAWVFISDHILHV